MKMIYIIGAGPAGLYAAYLLAKHKDVRVFEEHEEIGKPVQCTGILTSEIRKFMKDAEPVMNKISEVCIHSAKKAVNFSFSKPDIIVDRQKFDNHFYEKAKSRGNRIRFYLGHKLVRQTERTMVFQKKNKKYSYPLKKGDVIIGADGPKSLVYGLINKRKRSHFIGYQFRLKTKAKQRIDFFPRSKTFAWIVPESKDVIRIGMFGRKLNRKDFLNFVESTIPNYKKLMIDRQAGLIPIYDPKTRIYGRIRNKRRDLKIYLIGDASGFVKATTGGGIIPGLRAIKELRQSIIYNREFRCRKIRKELWLHLAAHRIFSKMNKSDWKELMRLAGRRRIKMLIESINRDNFRLLALKMIFARPSLIRYIFKL